MAQARGVGCPYFAGRDNMISRIGFSIHGHDLVLDNFTTAGVLALSDGYISVDSTEDYGIRLTGTQATAIEVAGSHTTGISLPASATITTGISIAETCTDAIKISGVNTDAIEISGANTYGINVSGANTDAVLIAGNNTGAGINITGVTTARAIMIGAFGQTDNLTLNTTRNYPLGVFGRLIADEATTADIRCAWFRLRVDEGVQIGTVANWGSGLKGIQGSLKFYGGTATGTYSWVNAGVFGSLETDGATKVHFKNGSVSAAVFAHCGVLATANDAVDIETGAVVAGIAINCGTSTASYVTVDGAFAGLYIYNDAGNQDFTDSIRIDHDCTVGINLTTTVTATDAILIAGANADGIHISGAQTAYGINISGACTTAAIMIDGTNKLMFDDSAMYMYASADGHLEIVADDTLRLSCPGWGSIQFGGEPDWGAGGGHVITGTGWDWCTATVAAVTSGALNAGCAAAYHSLAVNCATHSTASSFYGTWTELYIEATQTLTNTANSAAVWGQVECGATVTGPDQSDGDFMAGGYFNFKTGTHFTTGSYVNGVRIQSEVSNDNYTLTGSTWMAGLEILTKSGSFQNWTYGVKIAGADTGIDVGAATTGIVISGATTTGIYISGYAPTGIRVGGICNASIANLKSVYLETTVGASGVISSWIAGIHVETYVNSNATVPEHYGIIVQTYCDIGGNKDIFPLRLEHNGSSVANAFMNLQGSPRYLFNSSNTAEAWGNVTGSPADQAGWLKVRMGGNDKYILLYGTAP